MNKGAGGKSKGKGKSKDKHVDRIQATRNVVWKQFGKEERWEMEPETFSSRDLKEIDWSSYVPPPTPTARVKKVRFSEVEPKKVRLCNEFSAAALCSNFGTDVFCNEHQRFHEITIEADKRASRQAAASPLELMEMFGKARIPDKPTPEEHADMLEETRRNIWAKRAIFNGT